MEIGKKSRIFTSNWNQVLNDMLLFCVTDKPILTYNVLVPLIKQILIFESVKEDGCWSKTLFWNLSYTWTNKWYWEQFQETDESERGVHFLYLWMYDIKGLPCREDLELSW